MTGAGPIWRGNLDHINVETSCFSRIKGIGVLAAAVGILQIKRLLFPTQLRGKAATQSCDICIPVHPTRNCDEGVIFGPFKVSGSGKPVLETTKYWKSYGKSEDAMTIIFSDVVSLPSSLSLTVSFDRAV